MRECQLTFIIWEEAFDVKLGPSHSRNKRKTSPMGGNAKRGT
jgi:hypothetical protein